MCTSVFAICMLFWNLFCFVSCVPWHLWLLMIPWPQKMICVILWSLGWMCPLSGRPWAWFYQVLRHINNQRWSQTQFLGWFSCKPIWGLVCGKVSYGLFTYSFLPSAKADFFWSWKPGIDFGSESVNLCDHNLICDPIKLPMLDWPRALISVSSAPNM